MQRWCEKRHSLWPSLWWWPPEENNFCRPTRIDPTYHAVVLKLEAKRYRSPSGKSNEVFSKRALHIPIAKLPVNYWQAIEPPRNEERLKREKKFDNKRFCRWRIHIKLLDTLPIYDLTPVIALQLPNSNARSGVVSSSKTSAKNAPFPAFVFARHT